ncbi:hypothetical protein HB852_07565 [Listeria grandensis]|uniref:Uncharacterized protein n=2 Tax=Listeria grandensis TaxID=1494963 RepID=W7B205_9LIST|nr:hypothetical protein [Listeria grandensis]EUJ19912.1 hypothetical protein PGRAN_15097 [Listeria grandensis FSL F6-0971]MBC1474473.1 hypothetical protein [Listeria grandensis]MBC1937853.1 hypothetical protein [Listeria grandensis]
MKVNTLFSDGFLWNANLELENGVVVNRDFISVATFEAESRSKLLHALRSYPQIKSVLFINCVGEALVLKEDLGLGE